MHFCAGWRKKEHPFGCSEKSKCQLSEIVVLVQEPDICTVEADIEMNVAGVFKVTVHGRQLISAVQTEVDETQAMNRSLPSTAKLSSRAMTSRRRIPSCTWPSRSTIWCLLKYEKASAQNAAPDVDQLSGAAVLVFYGNAPVSTTEVWQGKYVHHRAVALFFYASWAPEKGSS